MADTEELMYGLVNFCNSKYGLELVLETKYRAGYLYYVGSLSILEVEHPVKIDYYGYSYDNAIFYIQSSSNPNDVIEASTVADIRICVQHMMRAVVRVLSPMRDSTSFNQAYTSRTESQSPIFLNAAPATPPVSQRQILPLVQKPTVKQTRESEISDRFKYLELFD